MILDRGCFERGCACYDDRVDKDGIEVVKKKWVGLTDDEIEELQKSLGIAIHRSDFQAIEAKLKEKNT